VSRRTLDILADLGGLGEDARDARARRLGVVRRHLGRGRWLVADAAGRTWVASGAPDAARPGETVVCVAGMVVGRTEPAPDARVYSGTVGRGEEKKISPATAGWVERVAFGINGRKVRSRWLHHAGVPTNLAGAMVREDGVLVAAGLTLASVGSGTVRIHADGLQVAAVTVSGATGGLEALSIGLSAGQILSAFIESPSGCDYPVVELWITGNQ